MKIQALVCATAGALLLAGCGEKKTFRIEGDLANADGGRVLVEKSDFGGNWIAVDSTDVSKNGSFRLDIQRPASPDIYRLRYDNTYIYVPVDSTETLTLHADARRFGTDFTLTGSTGAEQMERFEKALQRLDYHDATKVADFKRAAYTDYVKEGRGSIMSYYILTKTIDGKPLFDPTEPEDARYYAAVATQYMQYRPDDPHAGMLERVSREAMRNKHSASGLRTVVNAPELTMLEIELKDERGETRKLSDVAGHGKKTLVVFGMMNAAESPALNREIKQFLDSKGGTWNCYHISFDQDHLAWREAAANLPWTTVIDPMGATSNALRDYNVSEVPTYFVYDEAGRLTERREAL